MTQNDDELYKALLELVMDSRKEGQGSDIKRIDDVLSIIKSREERLVREALDLYQKDIKGWDINAYRAEGMKTAAALVHVADRSREYVDRQLNSKENK